MLIFTSLGGRL